MRAIDRDRIGEENEIRLAWHQSDLATLDVIGRTGVDGERWSPRSRFSAAARRGPWARAAPASGASPAAESPRHVREDR